MEVDTINNQKLMDCAAFEGGRRMTCVECGHRWQVSFRLVVLPVNFQRELTMIQVHLHIRWEPVERTTEVEDRAVKAQIDAAASDRVQAETALQSRQDLIRAYEKESKIIQKAAGQFSVYLKRSAIKPYNDSKLAYLDFLIDQEKGKVQVGGSDKKLQDLRADRAQHVEEIRVLNEYIKAGEEHRLLDEKGINEHISLLYNLEHMGASLQNAAQALQEIQKSNEESKVYNPSQSVTRRTSTMRPGSRAFASGSSSRRAGGSSGGLTGFVKSVFKP